MQTCGLYSMEENRMIHSFRSDKVPHLLAILSSLFLYRADFSIALHMRNDATSKLSFDDITSSFLQMACVISIPTHVNNAFLVS